MRTIIKSLIIASAVIAGGGAFADDNGSATSAMQRESQIAFLAQASVRGPAARPGMDERFVPVERVSPRAATSQGLAPVDTTRLSDGAGQ